MAGCAIRLASNHNKLTHRNLATGLQWDVMFTHQPLPTMMAAHSYDIINNQNKST